MLNTLAEGRPVVLGVAKPSSYSEGRSRCNGVLAFPQDVIFILLQLPSMVLYFEDSLQFVGGAGQVSSILLPFTENFGNAKVPWSADN